ncbi:hypothetical protein [Pseudaestuariivita rosea]|nr:hypothetical protein [Pseudaestuariivita rosea]
MIQIARDCGSDDLADVSAIIGRNLSKGVQCVFRQSEHDGDLFHTLS